MCNIYLHRIRKLYSADSKTNSMLVNRYIYKIALFADTIVTPQNTKILIKTV